MKKENSGFSLVELIIVIAIMSVLIGLLAPQYLKYVVKARKSSDVKTIDEISSAALVMSEDDSVYGDLTQGDYIITFTDGRYSGMTGPGQSAVDALKSGIESIVGNLSQISLKNQTWGTLQLHMTVGEDGAMTTSCTNTGIDSYTEYISGQ